MILNTKIYKTAKIVTGVLSSNRINARYTDGSNYKEQTGGTISVSLNSIILIDSVKDYDVSEGLVYLYASPGFGAYRVTDNFEITIR